MTDRLPDPGPEFTATLAKFRKIAEMFAKHPVMMDRLEERLSHISRAFASNGKPLDEFGRLASLAGAPGMLPAFRGSFELQASDSSEPETVTVVLGDGGEVQLSVVQFVALVATLEPWIAGLYAAEDRTEMAKSTLTAAAMILALWYLGILGKSK
jgi:hypothetical protein